MILGLSGVESNTKHQGRDALLTSYAFFKTKDVLFDKNIGKDFMCKLFGIILNRCVV